MARQRSNTVRIIGGAWRGRRLHFPVAPGLRPTADRRRETLFNWLAGGVAGARCLDLFAGSGALGFEAASRGAARVVLVEAACAAAAALASSRDRLGGDAVQVVHARAASYLNRPPEPFDLVFLDPPFDEPGLATDTARRLEQGWLAPGAVAYVELPARAASPALPAGWCVERETRGGDARGLLLRTGGQP